jgi:outer membrane beta-barrel protein
MLVIITAGTGTEARAFELKADEIRGKSSKQPTTVLQNRQFLKAWRPEAGMVVGTVLDEAYLDTAVVGARTGLFVNEWLGFEVQYLKTTVEDSDDRKALNEIQHKVDNSNGNAVPDGEDEDVFVTVDPEINALHSMTDFNAIAAPFYGKLNLLNKWIIYTDLYVSSGISRLETDQGDKNAFTIGAGERFYIGDAWSFRIDFKDRIFQERRAGRDTRKNSMTIDFGASYFFLD